MNPKELLNKYYAHLKTESLIKSLIAALLVGFAALAVSSLICWLTAFKAVWIVAIVFVVAAGASFPVFYLFAFRVDMKKAAQRADSFGLEERMLTMAELEGDTSYIAERQKEDALSAFAAVSTKITKFAIPVALVVATAVTAAISVAPTTLAGLSATGKAPSGSQFIGSIVNPGGGYGDNFDEQEFEITFVTNMCGKEDEGGFIDGDIVQLLSRSDEATAVRAEAEIDYVFVGWYDNLDWAVMGMGAVMTQNGVWVDSNKTILIGDDQLYHESLVCESPEFTPDMTTISEDTVFYALFMVAPSGSGKGDKDGEPSDTPPDPNQEPSEPSEPGDDGDGGEESPGNGKGGDTVIDGDTPYGSQTIGNGGSGGMIDGYNGTIGGN